ncbi:MAG: alpha/beta fold hydrolase [Firmicutes bacterium]|nr:alpha/beta fold hydrolase [Bacillota bacterium]
MRVKIKKSIRAAIIAIIAAVSLFAAAFYIYSLDYYRADASAVQVIEADGARIKSGDGITVFLADSATDKGSALIFYPGGKVEAAAYAPLLQRLSQNGITCVLVRMPFNLAVFDVNAADRVYDMLPDIKSWYIGGHSLGGAMASSYAGKNTDKIKGVVLLGAYPVGSNDISTLTVYGSEDLVLDRTKLEGVKNITRISGGNHAYFGYYGEQKGDGKALITREDQQRQTAEAIIGFIYGKAD